MRRLFNAFPLRVCNADEIAVPDFVASPGGCAGGAPRACCWRPWA